MKIPFNIPFVSGNEIININEVIHNPAASVNGSYKDKCITFLTGNQGYKKVFMTTSCTAALEVCSLLIDIKPGDEVIVPAYTFVSTANPFLRQGAVIVFADSRDDHPGIKENAIEALITSRTKAIIPVHYAGVACDMDQIMDIASRKGVYVIEDAALAYGSSYKSKPLGGIGHLGCLSFNRTKNLQCGEGGALIVNDERFIGRILSIIDKGTNRNELTTGKVKRYEWVAVGSAFMMTELHAAYLFAQLEAGDSIKERRKARWDQYYNSLKLLEEKGFLCLPKIPGYADHNAHTFYLVLKNHNMMSELISYLGEYDIQATVHYTSLDNSIFWRKDHGNSFKNVNSIKYNDCLLRLPLYNTITEEEIELVTSKILKFFNT